MSGTYLTEMANWFREAGLKVVEYDGWKTRARSTGGYATGRPWCVMWHHTASNTTPENDANYECNVADAKPICNVNIARDGTVWVLAAGATNTNGKGMATKFSKGTVPADSMNVYAFGIEIANNGVGQPFPQPQIDAAFVVSNVINQRMGNKASDVCTHQCYAPDRKVDPARGAGTVQGTWHPKEITSSGSWDVDDVKSECALRSAPTPEPEPDREDDDMLFVVAYEADGKTVSRGPALVGPGYWHFARNDDESFVWQKVYGPPRKLDNAYDFDTLVRTMALEPDDDKLLGPGA